MGSGDAAENASLVSGIAKTGGNDDAAAAGAGSSWVSASIESPMRSCALGRLEAGSASKAEVCSENGSIVCGYRQVCRCFALPQGEKTVSHSEGEGFLDNTPEITMTPNSIFLRTPKKRIVLTSPFFFFFSPLLFQLSLPHSQPFWIQLMSSHCPHSQKVATVR